MPDIFISSKEKTKTPVKKIKGFPRNEKKGLFSAFNMYPDNISFETKENDEKIIFILREHPILNIKWIFFGLILFLTPPLISKTGILNYLREAYPVIIVMAWYLVSFAYVIEGFFKCYWNVFFITTRRVIDVDFFNLINKRVSDAEIEKIQDVTYSTKGAIGTTLNYGDVLIQTAGEAQEIGFERVPNPEKVAAILDDLRVTVH
jgi:hypothetical protein